VTTLVIGLVLGAAGVIPVIGSIINLVRDYRGRLAGFWYQVTYGPTDETMSDRIHSIELLQVRHRGNSLRGKMWRIYDRDCEFNKCWTWSAKSEGSFVLGSYHATRQNKKGRSGLLHMTIRGHGRATGYILWVEDAGTARINLARQVWPMEWLAIESCDGSKLLAWIDTLPRRDCPKYLSWGARRCLFGWKGPVGEIKAGLALAGSSITPLPALEHQRMTLEAEAALVPLPAVPELKRPDLFKGDPIGGHEVQTGRLHDHGVTLRSSEHGSPPARPDSALRDSVTSEK
jgi:hypothetical protein